MVDRYLPRAWPPKHCMSPARARWLRLRTVAPLCPRSRQYDLVLTLPASLRDSVLAVQDITEIPIDHLMLEASLCVRGKTGSETGGTLPQRMAVAREATPVESAEDVKQADLDSEDLLQIYRNMLITR